MHIYFLRHGDASSDSQYTDVERPLTELGMCQAALVGAFLQRTNVVIDTALSSPFKRAQETASIVLSNNKNQKLLCSEFLLNGSEPQLLFDQLNELRTPSVLLVGHEPYLSETISQLIDGNRSVAIEMKKCTLALVNIPIPIHQGKGLLKFLLPVKTLA